MPSTLALDPVVLWKLALFSQRRDVTFVGCSTARTSPIGVNRLMIGKQTGVHLGQVMRHVVHQSLNESHRINCGQGGVEHARLRILELQLVMLSMSWTKLSGVSKTYRGFEARAFSHRQFGLWMLGTMSTLVGSSPLDFQFAGIAMKRRFSPNSACLRILVDEAALRNRHLFLILLE